MQNITNFMGENHLMTHDTHDGPCECGAWHPLVVPNLPFGIIQTDRLVQYYEHVHGYYEKWIKRLILKLSQKEHTTAL